MSFTWRRNFESSIIIIAILEENIIFKNYVLDIIFKNYVLEIIFTNYVLDIIFKNYVLDISKTLDRCRQNKITYKIYNLKHSQQILIKLSRACSHVRLLSGEQTDVSINICVVVVSSLVTKTAMVLETSVHLQFNHLTRLLARESFVELKDADSYTEGQCQP